MTKKNSISRRDALKTIGIAGTGSFLSPVAFAGISKPNHNKKKDKSLGILAIGVRARGLSVAMGATNYGRMVACCDVDTAMFGKFEKKLKEYQDSDPVYYTDYRKALERKDVDIVTIGTPDHWHALMLIDALEAGKDVYVEKPMTLTIAEGNAVIDAVRRTNRIVQVGTQQRSEYDGIFLKAVAAARLGLFGDNIKATVYLPSSYRNTNEILPVSIPPESLLWNSWLGPVQELPYCPERCHGSWRSWIETGYGPLTDWGAHHVDIAQWALGAENTGPAEIKAEGTFPLGREETLAVLLGEKPSSSLPNTYSTVRDYKAELIFENGNTIIITGQDPAPEYAEFGIGLLLEGDKGDLWLTRRSSGHQFVGSVNNQLNEDKNLLHKLNDKIIELYKGKVPAWMEAEDIGDLVPTAHMKNFIDSVHDRSQPISDVFTHHRANSSTILAHSSMILGRSLRWDPGKQEFINDDEANRLLSRKYHNGWMIKGMREGRREGGT